MDDSIQILLEELNSTLDEERINQIQEKIIDSIVIQIKNTECPYDFEPLKQLYDDDDFWDEAEDKINERTRLYLDLVDLRKKEVSTRIEIYKNVFLIIYDEKESTSFAAAKLKIDKAIIQAAYKILSISENIILNRFYSKRRYMKVITDISGISSSEAEYLWDIFISNKPGIMELVNAKRLSSLEEKINAIGEMTNLIISVLFDIKEFVDEADEFLTNDSDDPEDED